MAWIESHQELRDHPKVIRLTRLLDTSRTSTIGMLHLLWWWALDHAEDGDVSEYDAVDLADACTWDGDPEMLLKALCECGPGKRAGFLEEVEGRLVLHDWWQYAGKLVARRRTDRERKRAERDSGVVLTSVSVGRPSDVSQSPYVTEQNPTEQNPTSPALPASTTVDVVRPDVDRLCGLLVDLMASNGCRRPSIGKTWRTQARLLLDTDGVSFDEAERVMRWATADTFWRSNILSMPTFRAKFDTLRLQSQRGGYKRAPTKTEAVLERRPEVARILKENL